MFVISFYPYIIQQYGNVDGNHVMDIIGQIHTMFMLTQYCIAVKKNNFQKKLCLLALISQLFQEGPHFESTQQE